jgi:hypothetical protein
MDIRFAGTRFLTELTRVAALFLIGYGALLVLFGLLLRPAARPTS